MSEHVDEMAWVRPKAWKMDWELRSGANVVAAMSSPRMFGTSVTGTIGGEAYVLSRGGLRRPGAVIRKLQEREDLASLAFDSIGKGSISFPDGSGYLLERKAPTDAWTLSDESGKEIFSVERDVRSKYPGGKVRVVGEDRRTGILLLLSWFVISTSEC